MPVLRQCIAVLPEAVFKYPEFVILICFKKLIAGVTVLELADTAAISTWTPNLFHSEKCSVIVTKTRVCPLS